MVEATASLRRSLSFSEAALPSDLVFPFELWLSAQTEDPDGQTVTVSLDWGVATVDGLARLTVRTQDVRWPSDAAHARSDTEEWFTRPHFYLEGESAPMLRRFNPDAIQVMRDGLLAANNLGHAYIGTEHLLIGLTEDGNDAARALVEYLGLDRERLRLEAKARAGTGNDAPLPHLPVTPGTWAIMQRARSEAWRAGAEFVGPEHLFLGTLREGKGGAAQILTSCGLELTTTRQAVATYLGDAAPQRRRFRLGYRRWLQRTESFPNS